MLSNPKGGLLRSSKRLTLWSLVLLSVTVTSMGAYWLQLLESHAQLRANTLAHAELHSSQLAAAQADHIEALLAGVDNVLRNFRDQYAAGNIRAAQATATIADHTFAQGTFQHFSIVDANGEVLFSTWAGTDRFRVLQRDYLKVHAAQGRDLLYINKPFKSLVTGHWIALMTRPIFRNGALDGAAVIAIDPEYISKGLASAKLGTHDIVSSFFQDGTYFARSREPLHFFGTRLPQDRPFVSPLAGDQGVFRAKAFADGRARTYAWQKLHAYPLVLNVGLDEETMLAPVEKNIHLSIINSAISSTLILALCGLISWLMYRSAGQQKTLISSESLLRAALDSTADGLLVIGPHGVVLAMNHRFTTLWRIPQELTAGQDKALLDFVLAQLSDPDEFMRSVKSLYNSTDTLTDYLDFKDGRRFERYSQPVYFADQVARIWSFRDITEQHRAMATIQALNSDLDATLQAIPDPLFEIDEAGICLRIWAQNETLLANSKEELLGKTVNEMLPAEAAATAMAVVREVLKNGESFGKVIRLDLADGEKWFELSGSAKRKHNGDSSRVLMLSRDITDRIRSQNILKLAASVFTHAREAIMITDATGNIVVTNDTFTRITGYTPEEVVGKNPRLLQSGQQGAEFYAAMWKNIVETGHWSGEVWNRRKDGEVYAEILTISAVRDKDGAVQNYVSLATDITPMKEHQTQLEHIAHYDALTGLPNRVLFADRLQQSILQSERRQRSLCVVYLDLDGFKNINDKYGHAVGDELLIALAQRMKSALRDGDSLARVGGDEFVAVLVDLEQTQDCIPVLDRLLAATADPVRITAEGSEVSLRVSASIGATIYPKDGVEPDTLLRHADQAMYTAKELGKNRYHLFDVDQNAAVQRQRASLEQVRHGLASREMVLYYQPKVDLARGRVVGAEALIRWQHPERGLLAPGSFLPIVEGHQIGVEIGEWVIQTALNQMTQWRATGFDIPVSVNIGAYQLQQVGFAERLYEILRRYPDVPRYHLELEILESSVVDDIALVAKVLLACRANGVRFALDDFGTGYASLTYLKHLSAETLKIDQSFVRDMLTDTNDMAIVDGLIGLAKAFKREVIAEGVETPAHSEMLLRMGCTLAQGYGIARPMPAEQLPAWAQEWEQSFEEMDWPSG